MSELSPERFDFVNAEYPPEAFDYHTYIAQGMTKPEAKRVVAAMKEGRVGISDTYQVEIRPVFVTAFNLTLTWLSIKRRDREAFHDWRELQRIKNAITGPESEAVELYPAESRLNDSANQYHLWVLPGTTKWPFGYVSREVTNESVNGAKQRPGADEQEQT